MPLYTKMICEVCGKDIPSHVSKGYICGNCAGEVTALRAKLDALVEAAEKVIGTMDFEDMLDASDEMRELIKLVEKARGE